ncbi:hypothetical protein D3C78_962570 [compost metagenome]
MLYPRAITPIHGSTGYEVRRRKLSEKSIQPRSCRIAQGICMGELAAKCRLSSRLCPATITRPRLHRMDLGNQTSPARAIMQMPMAQITCM